MLPPSSPLRHLAALIAVGGAIFIRLVLYSFLGMEIPLLFLWPALLFAAWFGGLVQGLLATVLAAVVAAFWVFRSDYQPVHSTHAEVLGLALFVILGSVISLLTDRLREARLRVEEALRSEMQARGESEAVHKELVLESISDSFLALDADWRFRYVNAESERLEGRSRSELLGRAYWEECPARLGTKTEDEFRRAVSQQITVQFEQHDESSGRWFEVRAFPAQDGGLSVYYHDITDRRRAEEALSEAHRRKDEFLAMLGHELRNLLAPIGNALQVLRHAKAEPAQHDRAREILDRQLGHFARLVDDLLDTSRVARGKLRLQRQKLDLVALLRDSCGDHGTMVEKAGLALEIDLPGSPVWVDADATRLNQVVGNLLGNAVKFTDAGGRVSVSLKTDPELAHAIVTVRDTGIGIVPSMLPRLFDSFMQGERGLGRSRNGLGLGLALVKGLIELHSGKVEAHSDGPGQGASFSCWLPLVQDGAATPPVPDTAASPPSSP